MSKRETLGRGVRAVKGWMLRVSHQITSTTTGSSMDARQAGSERRIRSLPRVPERRASDRREIA